MKYVSRKNPTKEWFKDPQFLTNDESGYLVNPDTADIYWYHGMCFSRQEIKKDIFDEKLSGTLYIGSSREEIGDFLWRMMQNADLDYCIVYKVAIRIPAHKLFDVRSALFNEDARALAIELFESHLEKPQSHDMHVSEKDFSSIERLVELMFFDYYDSNFNKHPNTRRLLDHGYVGWVESEYDSKATLREPKSPITVAVLQESGADHFIEVIEEELLEEWWDD